MTKFNFLMLCMGALSLFACKNEPKAVAEDKPKAPDTIRMEPAPSVEGATPYKVTEGVVYWLGKKSVTGQHNGTINIKGGEILVKDGRIAGGKIEMDMTSLTDSDLTDATKKKQLESHLKSDEFFFVNRYPTAEFVIDEVLPSNMADFNNVVSGKLKIKDKSNTVNVPVKMQITDNELTATSATFIINRTEWGITYGSGVIGTVKDRMIEDNVSLGISLKAAK